MEEPPFEAELVEEEAVLVLEAEVPDVEADDAPDLEDAEEAPPADEKRLPREPFAAEEEEEPDGPEFAPVRPEEDDCVVEGLFFGRGENKHAHTHLRGDNSHYG